MNYAIIKNSKVINTVTADPETAEKNQWVPLTGAAGIGWSYKNGAFVPPPVDIDPIAKEQREKRDRLLLESDWTQLIDSPLSDGQKQAWASYRESLRLVPQQPGFPIEITWPSNPTS